MKILFGIFDKKFKEDKWMEWQLVWMKSYCEGLIYVYASLELSLASERNLDLHNFRI